MATVNVIFTRHKEWGSCNSTELYKIIESIHPDIIFEELSELCYSKIYEDKSLLTLESNAVKLYLQTVNIKHIPVDTYPLPDSYYKDLNFMLDKICHQTGIRESFTLRRTLDQQEDYIWQHGFSFLNSPTNDLFFEEIGNLKEKILLVLDSDRLNKIARMEQEMIENREEEMLRNIYAYSKEHEFNQAVFFIGSGHRKSIMQKINVYKTNQTHKLHWAFFGE
ncbi:hypothetical protein [Elizabethkingia anophelis]|uniref:hypothetical protein n=1 Tax=Elizabethkingia anophelis TaxID=1117645 RepID=UPI00136CC2EC|nr:hypothetical protein [Elizabethkingia anophelis]MYY43942.1 hypothetical protein [Elizabethkingia anophelis]